MEEVIKVATLENEIEAKLLAFIRRAWYSTLGRNIRDSVYDNIFRPKRWGFVNAPILYKKQILDILNDIRKSSSISLDDE